MRFHLQLLGVSWAMLVMLGCGSKESSETSKPLELEGVAPPKTATQPVGVAYISVYNPNRAPDRLIGASSSWVERIETHETVDRDGVVAMEARPDGFLIRGRKRFEMKPGGAHLMLIGLKQALVEGGELKLQVEFEKSGTQEMVVAIRDY